ncbi:fuseless domain containing protein [Nitzschia inconspicua]|uniref:Fuseless domain containing protein n=1 Tax=Nitzschia inconspicua TaxID=303405 RepID=A0A9K3K402_9STRA|nr:fuseless domain containing protein [Nitzschia inconspicua]KAG7371631.1 fuseless domain containing protein [Nitzschia inconspicua]
MPPIPSPSSPFVALHWKNVLTHVGVGMGAASFWRGAWYILDDHLFPQNATYSAASSLLLGTGGMALSQGLVKRVEQLNAQLVAATNKRKTSNVTTTTKTVSKLSLRVTRFGALYTIAMSCVLVWRGTWLGWDVLYEYSHPEQQFCERTNLKRINSTDPGHLTVSGMASHFVAVALLVGTGLFASVLAPPAATGIIRDFNIKAGSKAYQGPAQKLWNSIFTNGTTTTTTTTAAASTSTTATSSFHSLPPTSIMARNYHNSKPPAMSRLNTTTRMATSLHKF